MRYSRLLCIVSAAVLATACAAFTDGSDDRSGDTQGQHICSDSPKNAAATFLLGMKEFSFSLIRSALPENTSLWAIFGNNDEKRGQEVVKQVLAHPEIAGANPSCACSLYSITDTADPEEKVVVIKRISLVDDDVHDYKRAFRAHFAPRSNCITSVVTIDTKWERI